MRDAPEHLGAELREAQALIEAKDAELDALRERVAVLARAVEAARTDAERLLVRLSAVRERPETAPAAGPAPTRAV